MSLCLSKADLPCTVLRLLLSKKTEARSPLGRRRAEGSGWLSWEQLSKPCCCRASLDWKLTWSRHWQSPLWPPEDVHRPALWSKSGWLKQQVLPTEQAGQLRERKISRPTLAPQRKEHHYRFRRAEAFGVTVLHALRPPVQTGKEAKTSRDIHWVQSLTAQGEATGPFLSSFSKAVILTNRF